MIRGGLNIILCCAFIQSAIAQTMVPKLDQEGRKGDVARLAKQKAQERFAAADKDKDGRLSREEVEQDSPYLAEKFSERDLNHDGFLSWEEYVGHNRWER
jgi:hypothetical protein